MASYTIEIYRIIRESMPVQVEAHTLEKAKEAAKQKAIVNSDSPEWECYDCTYWLE